MNSHLMSSIRTLPQLSRCLRERMVMVALACLLGFSYAVAAPAGDRTLLVMGDSLSAAYGLRREEGWVALLQQRLATQGWRVVNASISGETSAGGASRIDSELLRHQPALVVIELGANDGLRGLPLDLAGGNLDRMIGASLGSGARVLLVGMRIPPNYGPDYTTQFVAMYQHLADKHAIPLLPFLLEPIAADRDAFQPDQLHPVAAAQPALLEHVWQPLQALLQPTAARRSTP